MTPRLCGIPGCDERHHARGWCRQHYRRWRQTGTPPGPTSARPTLYERGHPWSRNSALPKRPRRTTTATEEN